jgi:transcriptional regulator with XRE-family HTH domain
MHASDPCSPGSRFQTARKRAKLTQIEVAKAAGVAQSTVSDFESGKTDDIMAANLVRMCLAVSVPVEYVMLGSRAARDDEEAELISLLRGAADDQVRSALKSVRGIVAPDIAAPRKRLANGGR